MASKKKQVHRGQILLAAVSESGLSITQVVKRAGYSRSSYYNHVEDPHLPFHILAQYGKAVKHDFSEDFPQMLTNAAQEQEEAYGEPKTMADAIYQLDKWREKYYTLLERHQKILEERLK